MRFATPDRMLPALRSSSCVRRNRDGFAGVRTEDRNGLVLVSKVFDDALREHIEGPAEENVVCCISNDVSLKIQYDLTDVEGNISNESQRSVHLAVRRLHVQLDSRIEEEVEAQTDLFQHGDDLRTGVDDAFDLLFVVDQRDDRTNRVRIAGDAPGSNVAPEHESWLTAVTSSAPISTMWADTTGSVETHLGVTASRYLFRTSGAIDSNSSGVSVTNGDFIERWKISSASFGWITGTMVLYAGSLPLSFEGFGGVAKFRTFGGA
ncbi:hypothetical protein POSPLADRAFT_1156518 [Postia placenta MAD-698-R-SB12]|uniref:Uncharacterized protein n=1 Tax=Postia placenta MAD-698-R-SB12 TaxID=670580 RepID=A0A1X6MM04_9APHY|nr:hypothetical protein POSPLADRAFT_1156518 [Postia placenta MAD-698-R-SB12]OSX57477.1 hypothetical protein POSPLADRAFT_1156518 [Postia placenta MAD-698-R-SB12]